MLLQNIRWVNVENLRETFIQYKLFVAEYPKLFFISNIFSEFNSELTPAQKIRLHLHQIRNIFLEGASSAAPGSDAIPFKCTILSKQYKQNEFSMFIFAGLPNKCFESFIWYIGLI